MQHGKPRLTERVVAWYRGTARVAISLSLMCLLIAGQEPGGAQSVNPAPADPFVDNISYPTLVQPEYHFTDNSNQSSTSDRSVRFSAFAQSWLATGFGTRIGSSGPNQPLYQGRNYGVPDADGVRLRRAELDVDGSVSSELFYRGMVDLARSFAGGSNRQVLDDLYVGIKISRTAKFEVGRQNIGLGVEGTTDDNRLLTIARSIMSEDIPVHVGRLGDIRSTGAMLRLEGKAFTGAVGIWNDPGSQRIGFSRSTPPFADASVTYLGITRLSASMFGGTHVLEDGGEVTDRVGGALVWQRGPHIFQGEFCFARDYSVPNAITGTVGTEPITGYFMYGYSISKRLQLIFRYDNFDQGEVRSGENPTITTETGITIPSGNHKLREYTLGVNYFIDDNDKVQLNLIREDTEDNGAAFWGGQRTILLVQYQFGSNAPTRPQPLRGTNDAEAIHLLPYTNSIDVGLNLAPVLGAMVGVDIGLPTIHLIPAMHTRTSIGLLANLRAPSFLGFPGTVYYGAIDEISRPSQVFRSWSSFYAGFGVGGYFNHSLHPGARLLVGKDISRSLGVEVIGNITGAGRPYLTMETRIPL